MKNKITRRIPPHGIELIPNLHPLLQRILANRGIAHSDDIEKSLSHLLSFKTLLGIDKAVDLLVEALQTQQRILIIGDFDADGATSCTLAVLALKAMGAEYVNYLVPNRFEYGYGLTPEIVKVGLQYSPQLIITVDNGISSHEGVSAAKSYGINVLITDHHLAGETLPQAAAIVNPNQPRCPFPSKNLAGVGVIFYVMLALRSRLRELNWFVSANIPDPNMTQFLDLVAVGTVTDIVPLDKNNRILVYHGLQRIRRGECRAGIRALLAVGKRQIERMDAMDLGFVVGPRLNAAGRLDDISLGIECLLTQNEDRARELAEVLDDMNHERRHIEADMHKQALQSLDKIKLQDESALPFGLCLYDAQWHQGVIGILAGRIKDQVHRPVIVFALINDHEIKGSARSIPGLHIRDVLAAIAVRYPTILKKFGGHAMAAGLTLKLTDYPAFCKAFDEEVRQHLTEDALHHTFYTDGELSPEEFSIETAHAIQTLGPWGQAFPEPLFEGRFQILDQRLVGHKHLKLRLNSASDPKPLEAISFYIDPEKWPNPRCRTIHTLYRLDINEYQGLRRLQLILEELEPTDLNISF